MAASTQAHTLLFLEPGHFHAALTLRKANPRVSDDVHVYAVEGPELDAFVSMVRAFNERDVDPTHWKLHVHAGPAPRARLMDEARGSIAILAGRNRGKMAAIRDLHASGLHVLADKPWVTDDSSAEALHGATAGAPLCMDIMTERHDTVALLRKALLGSDRLLGAPLAGDKPAFEIESIHHLFKLVNGRPLRRPTWYYDVAVQGDGLVDIQTHMTDQAQWLFETEQPFDYAADFELEAVRRWHTRVSAALFQDSTGHEEFPPDLLERVGPSGLELACNGEIIYRLRGLRVRQSAQWNTREPAGSGDVHRSTVRGERATLTVAHNALAGHQPDIRIQATNESGFEARTREVVAGLQQDFPGLAVDRVAGELRLDLPEAVRTSHEMHFAMVLQEFLDFVDAGVWPAALPARIRSRHTLLMQAWALANEN